MPIRFKIKETHQLNSKFKLQPYSEGKLYSNQIIIRIFCIHIETTSLVDGTYELVSTNESTESQLNASELFQDPNQSSEELITDSATQGKPRSI